MATSEIQQLIIKSIAKGMTYKAFRAMVKTMAQNGQTSGTKQDENRIHYTRLNDKRMDRLDKTIGIPAEAAEKIRAYNKKVTWLVLNESWCGDAAQTLPVINKAAALNGHIDIKIALRDENEALMDAFLTDGSRAIPKLIMVNNDTKEVLHSWGPKPSRAMKMANEYKRIHGKLTPEFRQELQVWYNKDKGKNTLEDLLELLQS